MLLLGLLDASGASPPLLLAAPLPLLLPLLLLLLLAWLCAAWLGQACTSHSHDMLLGPLEPAAGFIVLQHLLVSLADLQASWFDTKVLRAVDCSWGATCWS
jgi:hypothetical protein